METRQEPTKTRQNPAEPGGTRRNPAETWRKPGGTWRKKSKLKGTTPPFNLLFFRQVPPGLRRVPLGSAAPPGAARFRWVPGFRQFSSAGLCRVLPGFRQQGSCSRLTLQSIARIVPGSCQAFAKVASKKRFLQMPGHCASQLMEKNTNKIASLVE